MAAICAGARSGWTFPLRSPYCLAFGASVFNTVRGAGQTYFDSVTMFIFFLGAGRYVELIVRQRSLSVGEAVWTQPSLAGSSRDAAMARRSAYR